MPQCRLQHTVVYYLTYYCNTSYYKRICNYFTIRMLFFDYFLLSLLFIQLQFLTNVAHDFDSPEGLAEMRAPGTKRRLGLAKRLFATTMKVRNLLFI